MKKIILMTVCMSAMMLTAYSQDVAKVVAAKDTSYWKKSSSFALNYNSGSFSQNWAGGGVNSVAFGVILNSKGDYEKGPITWTNDFQFQYGTLWNKTIGDWRKSNDRLFFDSKVGRKINSKWNFFASINFQSQIASGYKFGKADQKLANGQTVQVETVNLVSNLFAPAYITEAAGFEYKPNKFFSLQLAPIAIRQTIVADKNLYLSFPANYGLKPGNTFKNDLGVIQIVANYDRDIMKDVNFKARYQFFTAYPSAATKEVDPKAQLFGSSVNRLDAQLTAKVAKYFNVSLGLIGLYDQTQSTDFQIAQSIGVGFLYKW